MGLESSTLAVAYADGLEVGSLHFSTNCLHVHPRIVYLKFSLDENRADVAKALYEGALRALEPQDPLLLYTGADEDGPLLPALRALGFRPFRYVYSPTLDVQEFGLSRLDGSVTRAEALGYRVARLSDLEPTDHTKHRLFELFSEVYADTSTVVPATLGHITLDEW